MSILDNDKQIEVMKEKVNSNKIKLQDGNVREHSKKSQQCVELTKVLENCINQDRFCNGLYKKYLTNCLHN